MKGGWIVITVRKNKINYLKIVLALFLVIFLILGLCFYTMHPVIMKYAVSVAETNMLNSANQAILKTLEDVSYNDIAVLSNDENGYVTSLEINTYEVNSLKSKISNETARLVDSKEFYDIKIPIGTFFGSDYLNGFGPKFKFKMHLTSTAFVDFTHEFKSAGINQVLHIVNVNIKICGGLVINGYNKSITVNTSAIAAQTVIVGQTPDAFTNVVETEEDNTGGLINDYGY